MCNGTGMTGGTGTGYAGGPSGSGDSPQGGQAVDWSQAFFRGPPNTWNFKTQPGNAPPAYGYTPDPNGSYPQTGQAVDWSQSTWGAPSGVRGNAGGAGGPMSVPPPSYENMNPIRRPGPGPDVGSDGQKFGGTSMLKAGMGSAGMGATSGARDWTQFMMGGNRQLAPSIFNAQDYYGTLNSLPDELAIKASDGSLAIGQGGTSLYGEASPHTPDQIQKMMAAGIPVMSQDGTYLVDSRGRMFAKPPEQGVTTMAGPGGSGAGMPLPWQVDPQRGGGWAQILAGLTNGPQFSAYGGSTGQKAGSTTTPPPPGQFTTTPVPNPADVTGPSAPPDSIPGAIDNNGKPYVPITNVGPSPGNPNAVTGSPAIPSPGEYAPPNAQPNFPTATPGVNYPKYPNIYASAGNNKGTGGGVNSGYGYPGGPQGTLFNPFYSNLQQGLISYGQMPGGSGTYGSTIRRYF